MGKQDNHLGGSWHNEAMMVFSLLSVCWPSIHDIEYATGAEGSLQRAPLCHGDSEADEPQGAMSEARRGGGGEKREGGAEEGGVGRGREGKGPEARPWAAHRAGSGRVWCPEDPGGMFVQERGRVICSNPRKMRMGCIYTNGHLTKLPPPFLPGVLLPGPLPGGHTVTQGPP